MTPAEFREALDRLRIGYNDLARMWGLNGRTVARWGDSQEEGPSPPAAAAIRLMLARKAPPPEAGPEAAAEYARRQAGAIMDELKAAGWDEHALSVLLGAALVEVQARELDAIDPPPVARNIRAT